MRLIVSCPACQRRFNATGRKPGARFRCLCGAKVQIGKPRGHDAAVVRCSSCGAPRERDAVACGHCRADFTVHERDLHTVCPACLARVSDRARYCHHCATPLFAAAVAGDSSEKKCPACQPRKKLLTRRLGEYPLTTLECPLCVGLWLSIAELDHLFEHESQRAGQPVVHASTPENRRNTSRGYRPCVECGELMARRNFGRGKSGVIVDVCGRHGVWFDADELAHLVAWARAGGLEQARRDLALLKNSQDVARRKVAVDHERDAADARGGKPKRQANAIPFASIAMARGDLTWMRLLVDVAVESIQRLR